MEINHLIFDLGNTLLNFDLRLASTRLAAEIGFREEDLFDSLFGSELFTRFERGDVGPDELVSRINDRFASDLSVPQFDRMFSPIFTPRPRVISLLEMCKDRYELSLLSNTNVLHSRYIEATYPFMRLFDDRFYSHVLRAMKPHPQIFNEVLSRTQSIPEECLFIDDVLEHVEGARKTGIRGIHFLGEEQLEKELTELGILSY